MRTIGKRQYIELNTKPSEAAFKHACESQTSLEGLNLANMLIQTGCYGFDNIEEANRHMDEIVCDTIRRARKSIKKVSKKPSS